MGNHPVLPDIQSEPAKVPIRVKKVGLVRIRLPYASVHFGDGVIVVQRPLLTVYVDLPKSQRGIHASRSYESVFKVVNQSTFSGLRLEDICAQVAEELLSKHEYATNSSCELSGEIFRVSKAPTSMVESYEAIPVWAYAAAERLDGRVRTRRGIGVSVSGVTACPCAQQTVKTLAEWEKNSIIGDDKIVGTHMQRTVTSVRLFLVDGETVDLLDLADLVKECMSAPSYEALKRIDEGRVVLKALSNPLFVEDVARLVAAQVSKRYRSLDNRTRLTIRVRSIESIHSYDLEARLSATLGEIREGLRNQL
ncbi:GTP cyclohydrolase FolE2 [Candidatus Calditenuaceae archaeon HR02]|nr:GTP cyclohydrolase FolE2 [Candidatus Calditenuaceae archaeon HR02]